MASFTYGLSLNFANTSSQTPIMRIKYSDTSPHDIPRPKQAGMRSTLHSLSRWNVNSDASPLNTYVNTVAVTHDTNIGSSADIVMSIISTSSVNTSPAIGALKIPAIAPAAPHPTSVISIFRSKWNSCPRLEPMAEPVSTIGASAPTDPPKPMVMAEAITLDQQLCDFSRERLDEMA